MRGTRWRSHKQGCLAHDKTPIPLGPPRIPGTSLLQGPREVRFLVSEVSLYTHTKTVEERSHTCRCNQHRPSPASMASFLHFTFHQVCLEIKAPTPPRLGQVVCARLARCTPFCAAPTTFHRWLTYRGISLIRCAHSGNGQVPFNLRRFSKNSRSPLLILFKYATRSRHGALLHL